MQKHNYNKTSQTENIKKKLKDTPDCDTGTAMHLAISISANTQLHTQ